MNFWEALPKPFFILAPMEAVTDVVFRQTVLQAGVIASRHSANCHPELVSGSTLPNNNLDSEHPEKSKISRGFQNDNRGNRPDVFFTEFTNAASFCSDRGEVSTRGRLVFANNEQPIVAQIWGNNPAQFREMSRQLFERGFAGVDINTGCPDKSVVKNGSGSALIENPELMVELIKEVEEGWRDYCHPELDSGSSENNDWISDQVRNDKQGKQLVNPPISVKTRLGVRDPNEFREWLPVLLNENLANLTVHLRTRKEMSKVPAHFELIPDIIKLRDAISPHTKLTINGDIITKTQAMKLHAAHPGIDGFMIGRGVFANPFCFTNNEQTTRKQLFELLRFHLDEFDKWRKIQPVIASAAKQSRKTEILKQVQDDRVGVQDDNILLRKFDPLKRFFKIYVRDFDGAKELREQMMNAKTTDEVRSLIANF